MSKTEKKAGPNPEHRLSPLVACTLERRDLAGQAERWRRLRALAGRGRVRTGEGFRQAFRDDPTVEAELRALVAIENDCCAWARWDAHRGGGEIVLEVRSAGEGVATLHAMLADATPFS